MKLLSHILTTVACIIIIILSLYAIAVIPPIKRPFLCNDPTLSFPLTKGTISIRVLYGWSLLVPPFIIFFGELFYSRKIESFIKEKVIGAFKSVCSGSYVYFINFSLLHMFMAVVKTVTGSYRPFFFNVCMPDVLKNCTPNTYIFDFQCTNNKPFLGLYGANSSFFSGHAMLIAYSCSFSIFYLHQRFRLKYSKSISILLIQTILLSLGFFGCISRAIDYHHHIIDILAGSIVGIFGSIHIWYAQWHEITFKNFDNDDVKNNEISEHFL